MAFPKKEGDHEKIYFAIGIEFSLIAYFWDKCLCPEQRSDLNQAVTTYYNYSKSSSLRRWYRPLCL